jgi:phospholipid/cholesterol/gamma-HCH transport system substrate-binding protein
MLGNRVLGVLFIGLLVLAVYLVYAAFTQAFTSFDKVTLRTDTAGLQLPQRADVKIRGVLVGEVLDQQANGHGRATLTLGISPDKIDEIPSGVTASILPKTLFGEKYVSLDIPKTSPLGTTQPLHAGAVIDQTKMPIEVERVLNDFYPLLRTIQPAELNYTLNAIADALEGRGEQLGQSLVTLDGYLKRLNPQVPGIIRDLKLLSGVSKTYQGVIPELAATLRNSVTTGNTLVEKEELLQKFLRDTSAFSGTAQDFLQTNGDNLIRLGKLSAPQVALLSRYSPEFPCLLNGIVNQAPRLGTTFRGFVFHIQIEVLPKQPRGYNSNDRQVYGATNGPTCAGLPFPSGSSQANPYGSSTSPYKIPNWRDGVDDHGGSLGRGDNQRPAPSFDTVAVQPGGTPEESAVVRSLLAPAFGVSADRVAGVSTLLFGPAASGTEVSTR